MLWPNNERIYLQWINYAFIVYCCTPKALYNHGGGGLSSTTTSVQHPLGWCDGCHRTTALVRWPHTGYRWRGERFIEPIRWMHSPHTSYRWRGERFIEPIRWMHSPHTSYRWRGERFIEPIRWMHSPHTSYRWRGEREIEPIKWMGIIRRPWLTRASGGNLARTPVLHPYSLREVPWDF